MLIWCVIGISLFTISASKVFFIYFLINIDVKRLQATYEYELCRGHYKKV